MDDRPQNTDGELWRKCNACKRPIPLGAKYYVCSVSTCNQVRTGLKFCSVFCFETHLPDAKHRVAAAVEKFAPRQPEPDENPVRRVVIRTPAQGASPSPSSPLSPVPREVLVIASRLKEYIQAKSDYNTSASVMDALSDHLRIITDRAIENARSEGRRTVLDRDYDFLKR